MDEDAEGLGGGDVGGEDGGTSALVTPGGSSSDPSSREKPCMSMPMRAPKTSIILGSWRAPSANLGFFWII